MSARQHTTDVLIVGGGPSGLMAALLLARWGIRSIVLERNKLTDEHPKAHELNARSIEILRDAGIFEDELAAEASPLEDASRILFCRTINEEIGRIDLLSDPARRQKYEDHLRQTLPYMNLSQSEFEKILVKHVQGSRFVDLRFGHAWNSHDVADDGVVSTVRGANPYTVYSKYLLGCDGASSRVRRAAGIEMEGPAEIQSFVNAYFQLDLRERVRTPAKLFWIIHPEYAGTFVAHHMAKRWVYAVPVHEPWERPEDFTADVMRERIEGALGFAVPDLKITSISTWRMTAQVARSYRRGNVFLVGDAAHRFPPTGGLGMNTGIADAHNLCWKLALVLEGRAEDSLLDSYETERRPVALKNCAESHANFDKIWDVLRALGLAPTGMEYAARLMNSRPIRCLPKTLAQLIFRCITRPAYWLIGRGLRPGRTREHVHRAIAEQINHFDRLGLDIGYVYEQGAVAGADPARARSSDDVAEYVATTSPGARLPHRWVDGPQGPESTLDGLCYTEFRLFMSRGGTGELWTDLADVVRVVDTSGFPEDLFSPDQMLLVRPDGHIAWRGHIRSDDAAAARRAMESLLGKEPAGLER